MVVDSSGWLEYITGDTKSQLFAPFLERKDRSLVLVPTIVMFEVRKVLLLRFSKLVADTFVSHALRHTIVDIDWQIALSAAAISIQYKLAMADALLYSAAEKHHAHFVTSDSHFKELPKVVLL